MVDPSVVFKAAVVSSGTTVTGLARTAIGANVAVINNAPNTNTGDSKIAVDGTTAPGTTSTYVLRVIDVVPESAYDDSGTTKYQEVIVKINLHQYNNTAGI